MGWDFKTIIAGASGGLSIIYVMKKPEPWELVAGLVVGGLTANYVAPHIVDPSGSWLLFVAFFVGIAGKWICLKGLEVMKDWVASKG
jgi:hypothetical protein